MNETTAGLMSGGLVLKSLPPKSTCNMSALYLGNLIGERQSVSSESAFAIRH